MRWLRQSSPQNTFLTYPLGKRRVVADNDKDKILGYVYNYDLIRQSQVDPTIKIDRLLRDISTTPEMTPITDVLHQMIKKRTPIVVVVDEYGGTSGIITDKDIYEELFGTVRDEIDPSITDYIFKQPNGTFQVNGKLTTHDFERYFDADFPEFTNSDAVTLARITICSGSLSQGTNWPAAKWKRSGW